MNEHKKTRYEYFNPNTSEQKQGTADLASQISYFINHTTLKPGDWTLLDKMLKQLNKQKLNLSRKVLRSMQSKFESIQSKYER